MHKRVETAHVKRRDLILRPTARLTIAPHSVFQNGIATRTAKHSVAPAPTPVPEVPGFAPDPYLDYGRFLTDEGGILMIYKDLDLRFRHTLWRLTACVSFTIAEAYYLFHSPVGSQWLDIAGIVAMAILNWFIVKAPVELYRRVEIRPDCLINEGSEVFWARHMEGGWPSTQADKDGNQVLCGIYGTRFVEYLTIRRFDDSDRMSEVFSAHLQEAMRQQWARHQ